MKRYTVTFRIEIKDAPESVDLLRYEMQDLIEVAVLPALGVELVPVSFEIKGAKK